MTIEVTIKGLERDPQTGFVQILHGRFTAKKQDACLTESVTLFFYEEKDEFTPFEQLTEVEVRQWVIDRIDAEGIEKRLNDILQPPLLYGLPWDKNEN